MKIKGDFLKITSGALNVKGEKVEPEEQLARREVQLDIETKHGFGAHGETVGSIPGSIVRDRTAIEAARSMTALCGNCKWFAREKWISDLGKADSPDAPIERRRAVNQIRAALLQTQNIKVTEQSTGADNDVDIEHALKQLGYCYALYSFFKNNGKSNEESMTLVHPASSCPEDVRSTANPDGLFEVRSKDAEKAGTNAYDSIMRRAQGKLHE
jgi:hypothetical protein